ILLNVVYLLHKFKISGAPFAETANRSNCTLKAIPTQMTEITHVYHGFGWFALSAEPAGAASQGQNLHGVRGPDSGRCHLRPSVQAGHWHHPQGRILPVGLVPQKLSIGSTWPSFDKWPASLQSDLDPLTGLVDLLAGIRTCTIC